MVNADDAASFIVEWRAGYAAQFPDFAAESEFFITSPARGAFNLSILTAANTFENSR
jgi:hypothetical protein